MVVGGEVGTGKSPTSTNSVLSCVKFPIRYGSGQGGAAHLLSTGKAQLRDPHTPLEGSVL